MEIVIDPAGEERLVLRTAADIQTWADEQTHFWGQFAATTQTSPVSVFFDWGHVAAAFKHVHSVAATAGPSSEIERAISDAMTKVSFTARHPLASFMTELIKSGVEPLTVIAMYAMHRNINEYRVRMNEGPWYPHTFLGAAYRALFQLKVVAPNALGAFAETFNKYREETSSTLREAQAQSKVANDARDAFTRSGEQAIDTFKKTFADELKAFKDDLSATREHFAAQLALQAPMTYWTGKATEHAKRARFHFIAFALLFVAAVLGLGAFAQYWLLTEMATAPTNYWPVVLFSVAIAAAAWPIRLMAKFYLSQRHLYEDCIERAVIVQTFLALSKEVDMTPEDRKLLLAAVFRDSTAGLVKDDHPVLPFEALGAIVGKQR